MNYIKEAEQYLKYYHQLKRSVDHTDHMITKMKWKSRPHEIRAISNDITGIAAKKPSDTLDQLYELSKWQECKADNLKEIAHIECILDEISKGEGCERYGDLLKMWYVERMDKIDIASELNCSERNAYRLKESAVEKFAIGLFGIVVLRSL